MMNDEKRIELEEKIKELESEVWFHKMRADILETQVSVLGILNDQIRLNHSIDRRHSKD